METIIYKSKELKEEDKDFYISKLLNIESEEFKSRFYKQQEKTKQIQPKTEKILTIKNIILEYLEKVYINENKYILNLFGFLYSFLIYKNDGAIKNKINFVIYLNTFLDCLISSNKKYSWTLNQFYFLEAETIKGQEIFKYCYFQLTENLELLKN